jgi:hypothetical protein
LNKPARCTHVQESDAPEPFRVLFINKDKESKEVCQLISQHKLRIIKIEVEEGKDIPRLVTSERIFIGIRGIKDYLDNWAKVEKLIVRSKC